MWSLRTRLIIAAALLIAVGTFAAGAMLSAIAREHASGLFQHELNEHLLELERLAKSDLDAQSLRQRFSDPRFDARDTGFYWLVRNEGRIIAQSLSLDEREIGLPRGPLATSNGAPLVIEGRQGGIILAGLSTQGGIPARPIEIIVAAEARHLEDEIRAFNGLLAKALTAFALAMTFAAAILLVLALRPLEQLRSSLGRVRDGREARLTGHFPQEVMPLVDDLNALLGSTEQLVQRARSQAGTLAHGLKTPLAVLTDEAHRIAGLGLPKESEVLLEQSLRMQKHIDYQVARARAAATRATPGTLAAANSSIDDVVSALRRLYRDRTIAVEGGIDGRLRLACDAQDLREMLANIVDNACKYGRSRVRISTRIDDGGAAQVTRIEDDGPGLPPEAYDTVLKLGGRWPSEQPGSGFGLTIAHDLAQLYGGEVRLAPSSLGGLSVELVLPVATS